MYDEVKRDTFATTKQSYLYFSRHVGKLWYYNRGNLARSALSTCWF